MQLKPIVIGLAMSLAALSANATVTLTGKTLTQDEAWRVAEGEEVVIAPEARARSLEAGDGFEPPRHDRRPPGR